MNTENSILTNISVYGLTHALVDATSAAVIFSILNAHQMDLGTFTILVVLYNIIAFALQAPFGFIADKYKIPVKVALLGCGLAAVSTLIIGASPLLAVIMVGLGNALFHVGGGIISLNLIPKKAIMPGIYVAPGAFGLFVGALIAKGGYFVEWPFVLLLVLAGYMIMRIKPPEVLYKTERSGSPDFFDLAILLLLVSVAIRALIGTALVFPWKADFNLLLIMVATVVAGKGFGGFLADRFGWMRISLIGLLLSAPMLAVGASSPALGILGLLLFNLTMPVTLVAIANMLPGRAGLAFGLTTLALVAGALPAFTELKPLLGSFEMIITIILVSTAALFVGLKIYFKMPEILKLKK
jgi:FSR family fosmidomycin resistance protein-like MFS transporter